jgi:hypothetical protein
VRRARAPGQRVVQHRQVRVLRARGPHRRRRYVIRRQPQARRTHGAERPARELARARGCALHRARRQRAQGVAGGGGGPARSLTLEHGRRAEADPVRRDEALRARLGVDGARTRRGLPWERGRGGAAARERLALFGPAPTPEAEDRERNEHAEHAADIRARARLGRHCRALQRVVAAGTSRQRAQRREGEKSAYCPPRCGSAHRLRRW